MIVKDIGGALLFDCEKNIICEQRIMIKYEELFDVYFHMENTIGGKL